jgi:ADP-ribose pyrophosphatase YjhB (NUDIX family)
MDQVRSYSEKNASIQGKNPWIPEGTYETIAKSMIIPCVDIIFHTKSDRAIYLAKRVVLPMNSYWCLGGRIFFDDCTLEEAAARSITRESELNINSKRFKFVCNHLYSWEAIAQGYFTGRNLAVIFSCEVTVDEIDKISKTLNETEFDKEFGLQRFDRQRLLDMNVHQAMIDVFDQLFSE